ncbi:MAG TPA: 4Fe-4S dicluster domain-containing protein [Candidatus Ozemobacteraceae bacterium]|nr:4Fe-4S dicluster domain-containing protein [Candidatus Ozemobacteraceae bacterium]
MKFIGVDTHKCVGAKSCEKTCARTFFKTEDVAYSAIRVTRTKDGWDINVCNQCGTCIGICPAKAISRNKAGTVVIDKSLCVGCFMCVGFCPTLSMRVAPGGREPFKCVSCGACAKACRSCALTLSERDHAQLPS